jgi:stearoyl-CoA desaturase (delta-9 desaturase)
LWWAAKHKHHHATEDAEGDPHSPHVDGFWYAHMGWMLSKKGLAPAPNQYQRTFLRRNADGRFRYAPAHWQGKYYFSLAILMTFGVPLLGGLMLGDWWGGLLVVGFARLMLQYHLTWVVNSAGHMWGQRLGGKSTNLWPLALLTVGESFHANHHDSPGDYRLGRKWWEVDLGRYAINFLYYIGLASELRIPSNTRTK